MAPKKEYVATKALCKSLLRGYIICFPQTQQSPSHHHFKLSESTNNSRLVLPRLKGWPGSRELPWNSSGIKLQLEQQGGAFWPPLALQFLLMSLSHTTFRATQAFLGAKKTPCYIHPYNLMSLAPKCHKTRTPVAIKKKKNTPQKQKTHNTKIALKTKGMIKINQSNTTFLKSTAFKDLQMKRSPIYTVHLPKQRSVSCCCQVEPANSLL